MSILKVCLISLSLMFPATLSDIRTAYLDVAAMNHPRYIDASNAAAKLEAEMLFVCIAEAYSVLSEDGLRRRRYDHALLQGETRYGWNRDWSRIDDELGLMWLTNSIAGRRLDNRVGGWSLKDAETLFRLEELSTPRPERKGAAASGTQAVLFLAALSVGILPIIFRRRARWMAAGMLGRGRAR